MCALHRPTARHCDLLWLVCHRSSGFRMLRYELAFLADCKNKAMLLDWFVCLFLFLTHFVSHPPLVGNCDARVGYSTADDPQGFTHRSGLCAIVLLGTKGDVFRLLPAALSSPISELGFPISTLGPQPSALSPQRICQLADSLCFYNIIYPRTRHTYFRPRKIQD